MHVSVTSVTEGFFFYPAAWEKPPGANHTHINGTCVWLDTSKYRTSTTCEEIRINWVTNCYDVSERTMFDYEMRAGVPGKFHLYEMSCAEQTKPFSE